MAMVTVEIPDAYVTKILNEYLAAERPPDDESRPARRQAPARASADQAGDDPWGSGQAGDDSPAGGSGPPRGGSGAPSGVITDDKGRTWAFGAPGAPDCQCGEPAVSVKGKTNGKAWSQWRCAKDYDDFRNKCQFSQFIGGKR